MKSNIQINNGNKSDFLLSLLCNDDDHYQRLYYRGICIQFSIGEGYPLKNNIYDLYGIYHFLSRVGKTNLWDLYKPTEDDSVAELELKVDSLLKELDLDQAIFNKYINESLMYDVWFYEMIYEFDFEKKYKTIEDYLIDLKQALEPNLPQSSLRLEYKVETLNNSKHRMDLITISYKSTILYTIFFIDLEYYDSECDFEIEDVESIRILNEILLNL